MSDPTGARHERGQSGLAPAGVVEAVHRCAERLELANDPRRLAGDLLQSVVAAFAAARGSILQLNPKSGRLRVVAAHGLAKVELGVDLPPSRRRIADHVLRAQRGLVLNGEIRDERFDASAPSDHIVSALSVPLPAASGNVGVLNLARVEPALVFSASELRMADTVAPAIGALIERTQERSEACHDAAQSIPCCGLPADQALRGGGFAHAHVHGSARRLHVCERFIHADGSITVMLARPAGDGPSAARLGEILRGLFQGAVEGARGPAALASVLHARLGERVPAGSACAWLGSLDAWGRLQSCTAGHAPPILLPADGEPGPPLRDGGPALGAESGPFECSEAILRMLPGDTLVALSNGVLEAQTAAGEPFGEARALELLCRSRRPSLTGLVMDVTDAARMHSKLSQPVDDLVAVALRFTRD
jgi:hypothetical protein